MRAVVAVAAAAALLVTVVATGVAHALTAREVQLTPRIDWRNWTVLLEVPRTLLGVFTGLYVSNVSDCSAVLPTWWQDVGGMVYIVFNSTRPLLSQGTTYTYYLCYGDILLTKDTSVIRCALPGQCTLNYTEAGADLTNTSLTVEAGGTGGSYSASTDSAAYVAEHTYSVGLAAWTYVDNATMYVNTTFPWPLYGNITYGGSVIASALFTPVYSYNTTGTASFDTGLAYYDTGNVTILQFSEYTYVRDMNITINVYDSDWDTYYVYLYVNGRLAGEWYEQSYIVYRLTNTPVYNVTIRVYDTELNDWVRAWGTIDYVVTHHVEKAVARAGRWVAGPVDVVVSAAQPFTVDTGSNFTLYYYNVTIACGSVEFSSNDSLVYVEGVGLAGGALSWNATMYTAVGGASAWFIPGLLVARGDTFYNVSYAANNMLAVSPDTAAVANLLTGQYGYVTVSTVPLLSGANITLCVAAGPPAAYNLTWIHLYVTPALANYTILIGSAYTPTASSTGATAGNTTVVVNVAPSPYSQNYYLATVALAAGASFTVAVFLYLRGWRRNSLSDAIIAASVGAFGSIVVFALGAYDIARYLLVATTLPVAYSIVDRLVDVYLLRRRRRLW